MKRPTTKIAASLAVALAAGLAWSAPAAADPPHWAPAHGYRAKHHHGYYAYPYPVYPRPRVVIVPPPVYIPPPPVYYYPPPVYFPPTVRFSATIRGW